MSVTWTRTLSTANARKTNRRERGIRGRRVGVGGMRRGEKYTPSENMRRHRAAEGVVVHASSGAEVRSDSSPLERVAAVSDRISSLFPVFVAIASTVALHRPSTFSWFNGRMLIAGLCFTMLSMGTTLSPAQLLRAVRGGRKILAGVCLQYSIMPMLGYAMSKLAGLSPEHTAGIVLVSCCPGGVASNVVCYLAGADVPLSVALTSVSTILAVAMTPTLTSLLLGTSVAVDALGLFNSTLRVVLIPVLVGSLLSQKAPKVVAVLSAVAPAVSVIAVVFINASVVAQSASSILATGGKLVLACFILHSGGFALGYAVSRLGLKIDEKTSRTMSVEVGMQNRCDNREKENWQEHHPRAYRRCMYGTM